MLFRSQPFPRDTRNNSQESSSAPQQAVRVQRRYMQTNSNQFQGDANLKPTNFNMIQIDPTNPTIAGVEGMPPALHFLQPLWRPLALLAACLPNAAPPPGKKHVQACEWYKNITCMICQYFMAREMGVSGNDQGMHTSALTSLSLTSTVQRSSISASCCWAACNSVAVCS